MTQISSVEKTSDAGWLHFSLPDCLFSFAFMRPRRTQICSSYWSVDFSLPSFCFQGLVRRHSSPTNICSKPAGWFRGYFSSVYNVLCFTWSQLSQLCTFTEIRTFLDKSGTIEDCVLTAASADEFWRPRVECHMQIDGPTSYISASFDTPHILLLFCQESATLLAGLERKRQSTSTFAYIIPLMSDSPLQRSKFLAES